LQAVKEADAGALASVLNRAQVNAVLHHFHKDESILETS